MADIKGDPTKQPIECRINDAPPRCPNIDTISETMSGETWKCNVCGERYKLYYEDMQ